MIFTAGVSKHFGSQELKPAPQLPKTRLDTLELTNIQHHPNCTINKGLSYDNDVSISFH